MRKGILAVTFSFVLLLLMVSCSSEKTWYEDDDCVITGFSIQEISDGTGMYSAKGSIELKDNKSSEGILATVTLFDKDGNEIGKAIGMANDIQAGRKADFLVPLYVDSDFIGKDEVDAIDSYRIENLLSNEDVAAVASAKRAEALELEEKLENR